MANEFKIKKGLIVHGSGSTVLDVQGTSGQLFSIADDLTGDVFTVSDISGIPLLNVNADTNTTTVGGSLNVSGDTAFDTDTLYIDSVNNRVGIGTTSPITQLDVRGNAFITGGLSLGTAVPPSDGLIIARDSTNETPITLQNLNPSVGTYIGILSADDPISAGYSMGMAPVSDSYNVYHWIFHDASIIFGVNNSERLRISNTATSVTANLTVSGSGAFGGNLTVSGSGTFVGNGTVATFKNASNNGADTGISIRGARNGLLDSVTTYINFDNFDDNSGGEHPLGRIYGSMASADGNDGTLTFQTYNGSAYVTGLNIDEGGNVGIGTTSPSSKLEIYEVAASPTLLTLTNYQADIDPNAGQGNFIDFQMKDGNETFNPQVRIGMIVNDGGGDSGISSEGQGNFVVYTSNTNGNNTGLGTLNEQFRINYNGNVGIGINDPTSKLHVNGNVTATSFTGSLSGNASTATKWATARTVTFANGDVTGNFTIDGSANVSGIELTVANDSHTHDGRYYTETEADTRFVNVSGDTMTGGLIVESSGSFGSATTTGTVFEVVGSSGQLFSIDDDLTGDIFSVADISGIPILNVNASGQVDIDGDLTITGDMSAATITETSSERYKENIKDIGQVLDTVNKLRPVSFNWKKDGRYDYGFIAEEVDNVIPELVKKDTEGVTEGLHYSKLTSFLIGAVQELTEEISNLKKEIEELKK